MLIAATGAVSTTTVAYNLLYILIGLFLLGGAGGGYGLYRAIKSAGVKEAKIDRMLAFFEGDGTKDNPALKDRLDSQDRQIALAVKATSSNGLNTNQVGDIAKRTENAVAILTESVNQHIGESRESHRSIWKELGRKVDKT